MIPGLMQDAPLLTTAILNHRPSDPRHEVWTKVPNRGCLRLSRVRLQQRPLGEL